MRGEALPPLEHDPNAVRSAADEILSDARFEEAEPGPLDRALEWVFERLGDLFRRLFEGLGVQPGSGGSSLVAYLILGVALVGAVVLLVRYLRSQRPADLDFDEPESEIVLEPRRSSDEWRELARQHEARGAWREAVRAEHRALVADLVEDERLPDIPGRTAGEYRADIERDYPTLGAEFGAATDLFQGIWYATGAAGPDQLRRMRDLAASIDVQASRTEEPA